MNLNVEYSKELAENIIKTIQNNVEIKQVWETYSMVVTTEVEDRDWEVVKISWIDYSNYMSNPVVLQDHSYKVENIIGKTLSLRVEGNSLVADFVFADTEHGRLAKELYDNWFLKTSSIWFIVYQRDENNRDIITKCELLEWSLVAVPCNPKALSLDWKSFELFQKGVDAGLLKSVDDSEMEKDKEEELEEIDVKTQLSQLWEKLDGIYSILKTLADDNAELKQVYLETKKQEEFKKQAQELTKALSGYLCEVKKVQK